MADKKEPVLWPITITSMFCISGLEGLAIYKDLDGVLFSFVVVVLAGLGGFAIHDLIKIIRK